MSGKIEREIEDILRRYDKSLPRRRRWKRRLSALGQRVSSELSAIRLKLRRVTLGQIMLSGMLLLLIAFFFRSTSPYTVYAGLALFFGAFVLSFRRSHDRPEVRWRGRSLDVNQATAQKRIKRWWQRRGDSHRR